MDKNKNGQWRVFHFVFTAGKKQHRVTVVSASREEARALIRASFRNAGDIRETA